jgi:hypothetical protein
MRSVTLVGRIRPQPLGYSSVRYGSHLTPVPQISSTAVPNNTKPIIWALARSDPRAQGALGAGAL